MTNQEFVDSLSPKAKEIIKNYQCKNIIKNKITVYLTDTNTKVNISHPDTYIFEIKKQESFYDMEYVFLHEFYHCVQKDSGYPNINYTNIKYQNMATFLSSVVLDCDVYNRLLQNGYDENPNTLHNSFIETNSLLEVVNNNKQFENYTDDIEHIIFIAGKIVLLDFFYTNKNDVKNLIIFTKEYFPNIYNTYKTIFDAIKQYEFTTPKNVYKTFKTIIRKLKLEEFVTIS